MNWQAVLEYVFPPQCGSCARVGAGICERCVPAGEPVFRDLPTLRISAIGAYEGDLRRIVLALKSGRRDIARSAAGLLAQLAPSGMPLVPVPTTGMRRRERGFDGCVLMARVLAQRTGGAVLENLRHARGDRQRGRSRGQRLAARGRFRWYGEALDGMEVVLLDDVVTTGATLEDCAAAVRAVGGLVTRSVAIAVTP